MRKSAQEDLPVRVAHLERELATLRASQNAAGPASNHPGTGVPLQALDTVLSHTPDFAYSFDLEGRFTYANRALLTLWQKDMAEVLGKTFAELHYPAELAERLQSQIAQVAASRQPIRDRTSYTGPAGETRSYDYIFVAVVSPDGRVEGVAGSTRDITEQVRAEQFVLEDQRRWRDLLLRTPAAMAVLRGPDLVFEWVNAEFARLVARPAEALNGKTVRDALPELHGQIYADLLSTVYATGEPHAGHEAVVQLKQQDGVLQDFFVNFVCMATRDMAGRIDGIFVHVTDVTDLVTARKRVEESEARFRAAVQANSSVLWTNNAQGEMVGEQPGWGALTGQSRHEYEGFGWSGAVHPDDAPGTLEAWNRAVAERRMFVFEHRVRRHDGAWRLFSVRAVPVLEPQGHIREWVGVHNDITDERTLLDALQHSETRFRQAIDSMPQLVWSTRPDGTPDLYSKQWLEYTGLSDAAMQGQGWHSVLHPDDRPRAWERWLHSLRSGEIYEIECRCRRFDAEYRWFLGRATAIRDERGQIVRWFGTCTDIEDRKKAELAVLTKQKLESLGLLAGGIAHDFNNLLVGVLGGASYAAESLPGAHPLQPVLQGIVTAGERAAHLTRQMLAYAGKGKFLIEPVAMSELARSTCDLIKASIPPNVQITLDTPESLPVVEADQGQMQQIVMNLILNAAEAMEPSRAGTVAVRTSVVDLDAAGIGAIELVSGGLVPGPYLVFEVQDNGGGMDRETKAKIFDPFFTTKFTGRGLGLSAVQGIVRSHNAALSLQSMPGEGSTFRVFLPASRTTAPGERPLREALRQAAGTVLVVDDEEIVRNTAKAALERVNYKVLLAAHANAALQAITDTQSGPLSLILLDMTMPGMKGKDIMLKIRQLGVTVPVLICSGYSEAEVYQEFFGLDIAGVLQKPFTTQQLRAKIGLLLPPSSA